MFHCISFHCTCYNDSKDILILIPVAELKCNVEEFKVMEEQVAQQTFKWQTKVHLQMSN